MSKNNNSNSNAKIDSSLWDFASRVYALPEAEQLFLRLQDDYLANINIILWCCWLENEELDLSVNWLDEVLITIDSVSQQTVAKLREVRRLLKSSGNFTKVQALSINKHILNAELMIEKVLLNRLQDLTQRFVEANSQEMAFTETHTLDLQYYFDFLHIPESEKFTRLIRDICQQQTA